jgi:hypothetical protein
MAAFGDSFTVYGGCKVNLNLASTPLVTALIIQHAASPNDPALQWENLAVLARFITYIRDFLGGYADLKSFMQAVEQPMEAALPAFSFGAESIEQLPSNLPMVKGVKLNKKTLQEAVVVGGARRIWQITATARVGRIQKKIKAVWDMKHISSQMKRTNMGPGGFLYWREE